jgi:plastocyanin
MRRRLIVLGIAAGALLVPGLASGGVVHDVAVNDADATHNTGFYAPKNITAKVGTDNEVNWLPWDTVDMHNIRQNKNLFSSGAAVSNDPDGFSRIFSAGTFGYFCTLHGAPGIGMAGTIKVKPTMSPDPAGKPFTVIWSGSGTQTGNAFDVRYRVGNGKWKMWKKGTKGSQAVFGKNGKPVAVHSGKAYKFQVRSKDAGTKKVSGYSPSLTVKP